MKIEQWSASGGAATAFFEAISRQEGSVFGVTYSVDFTKIKHCQTASITDLTLLRGSKYAQSDKGYIYLQVKKDLFSLSMVLLIKTSYEVGALKAYLDRDYNNLIICVLICQGIMSLDVKRLFVKGLFKKYNSEIVAVRRVIN